MSNGVGVLLRRHRAASGLTQEELAQRSGLSIRAIADIERGRTSTPYRRSVSLLADALMLSVQERDELVRAARAARVARATARMAASTVADPGVLAPRDIAGSQRWPVPRQLPAAVSYFSGRAAELSALRELLDPDPESTGRLLIAVIQGTAGVGKTALAVCWAHHVADRFPDGQFFVSLHGFNPSEPPVAPGEAIRGLLEALGVPLAQIPPTLDARAALYRSLLAERRMLVLLDNARDAEQVRPLLPGGAGNVVVVTSRSHLTGLVASDGAHPLHLDVLTAPDATELLARRLGAERLAAQAQAAGELPGLCAGLPLALSIVTAHALGRSDRSIAALARELTQTRSKIDQLDAGDASTSVRAVLSWSYQALGEPVARMFRLLGTAPGPSISVPAAAALAAVSFGEASAALGELSDAHLVANQPDGRFTFHDLLRAYAMERLAAQEAPADRDAAIRRILTWYLHTATAAARTINPRRRHVLLDAAEPGIEPLAFPGYDEGLAWLDAERANLIAAVDLAASQGEHEIAWKLPLSLRDLFSLRGRFDDCAAEPRARR